MQILNKLIFPKTEENCTSLYFRGKRVQCTEKALEIERGGKVTFDSYFNLFEHALFQQKTNIQKVQFQFEVQGDATITIFHCGYTPSVSKTDTISVDALPKMKKTQIAMLPKTTTDMQCLSMEIELSTLPQNGFLYAEIKTKQGCVLHTGQVITEENAKNTTRICLAYTAYKKPDVATKTARAILQYLAKNQLQNVVDVYMVDTNNCMQEIEGTTLLQAKNWAETGGITRAMLASLQGEYTHCLYIDENMHFEVESIGRIYALLKNLKANIDSTVIAGSLLKANSALQYSKELFMDDTLLQMQRHLPQNLDLNKVENLYKNTVACTEKNQFASWKSLVCYPKQVLQRHGFSLPFYHEWADIEYGLRLKECTYLYANGLGVLHDTCQALSMPKCNYYMARNQLITNLLHHRNNLLYLKTDIQNTVTNYLLLQRYDEATTLLQGYQDALKGAEYFVTNKAGYVQTESTNGKSKFYTKAELLNAGFAMDVLSDKKAKVEKNAQLLAFENGNVQDVSKVLPNIHYSFEAEVGLLTEFDEKRENALKLQLQKLIQELVQKYPYIRRAYRTAFSTLISATTWEKLLDLPKIEKAHFEREQFVRVAYFVDSVMACKQLFQATKQLLDARISPIVLTHEKEVYTLLKNKRFTCYLLPKVHKQKITACMQILFENDIQILHNLTNSEHWLQGICRTLCRPCVQGGDLTDSAKLFAMYDSILLNLPKAKKVTAVLLVEESATRRDAVIQMLQKQLFKDFNLVVVERKKPYAATQKLSMQKPVEDMLPPELASIEGLAYFTLPSSATQAQIYQYALEIVRYSGAEWIYCVNEYAQIQDTTLQKLVLATLGKEADISFVTSNIQCQAFEADTYAFRVDKNVEKNREIASASFTSTLINTRAITQYGLPLKIFRNDLCDREYTLRLSAAFGNGVLQAEDTVLLVDAPRLREERLIQRCSNQFFLAAAYFGKEGLELEKNKALTDTKHKSRKNKKRLQKLVKKASKLVKEMPVVLFNNRYNLDFIEKDVYIKSVAKTTSKNLLVKYEQFFTKLTNACIVPFCRKGKYNAKSNLFVIFAPEKL